MAIIRKFKRLVNRKQKIRIVILFFMMLIGAVLEVVGVTLMLPLITAIMQPDIINSNMVIKQICEMLDLHSHRTFVIVCIIALICVFILKDLFLMLQYYAQARFVFNNRFATQQQLLHSFINRPYEYYLHAQSGEIIRIIQEDVRQTYALLTTLLGFATETIISVALVITIFVVDPFMTLFIAFMMCIIMVVITKIVKPILRQEGLSFQRHSALTNKWLLQAINGIKEVKVGNKERFFEDNYEASGRKTIQAEKWSSVLGNIPRLLIEMVSVCSMLVLIAIMIYMGRDTETLIPSIGAFAMAAVKLMPSANRIVGALNSIAYQEPALDKLLENIEVLIENKESEQINEQKASKKQLAFCKEIILDNISYQYPNSEKQVLKNLCMQIPIGKSIGLVGTSGAGKTTVVDIMLGLLVPHEGKVSVDGTNVTSFYAEWLASIGYIPQAIFMLDDTIRANVAFGISRGLQSDDQVWRALEEAHLADYVRTLPEGLDTQIGERGVRLSGGQRQRIGIARALYTNPDILIFDEATSALDNETEAAIMESINELRGKKTMIIIAHRLQTIEGCDIVYRVSDGKIIQER